MNSQPECERREAELNLLLKEFKAEVSAAAPAEDYVQRVHRFAARIYVKIAEAILLCGEVSAEKDNGRILRMERVGPLRGTRFTYSRSRGVEPQDDECDLMVVTAFKVRMSEGSDESG